MDRHLFMFGDADEELLLALGIAVEQWTKEAEAGDNNPAVTAADLWESLEQPGAVHTSLRTEWPTQRRVALALGRLRKRKLVTRLAYSIEGPHCWNVTDSGYRLLGKRMVLKPERPRREA
jgi:hypothetical protein